MSDRINGISIAEDFRQAAEAEREARAVPVRLPSGLVGRLIKPTPLEVMLRCGRLPQSLAAAISAAAQTAPPTTAEVIQLSQGLVELVRFIFVFPRVPDECKPGQDIPISDIEWAIKWGNGEVVDGQPAPTDLAGFSGTTPAGGPDSEPLRTSPERVA